MRRKEKVAPRLGYGFKLEMAKPPLFDRDPEKVVGFMTECKLYIRIRMRERLVKRCMYKEEWQMSRRKTY